MPFVCMQPSVTAWSRRTEDLTPDKTDEKDAVLIARLTAQLKCYEPEPVDETWARLRHLGIRREQLISQISGQVQQMRDLLECVWPAVLDTAQQPFRSVTWIAVLTVVVERDGGDLHRTRRLGWTRFETALRRQILKQGRQKPCLRIGRRIFAALTDLAGVTAHRVGALERVALLLEDWHHAHQRLADTETRMITVLDELGLTDLVTSITGLSPIGATANLAQTGTCAGFSPHARWSNMPGWRPGRNWPAPSSAAPNSPAKAGPGCGWPPGGRSGERNAPNTRFWARGEGPSHVCRASTTAHTRLTRRSCASITPACVSRSVTWVSLGSAYPFEPVSGVRSPNPLVVNYDLLTEPFPRRGSLGG
jgi:Transposase